MADDQLQLTLLDHINELRQRLLVCVVALAITTILSFTFSQTIAEFLAGPIGGLQVMEAIDVTENMSAFMRISLLSGLILALPVILYEILAFIMPGLNPNERVWIWMAVPSATIFFLAGVAFSYFVMLPAALPFLISFMGINTSPRPSTYFGFVANLMFWVGIIFEMPLLMYILAWLKIISAKDLAKQWRVAIIVSAIVAALITPTTDPVNMGLLMLPLFVLYLISILFAFVARREKKPKKAMSKRTRIILFTLIIVLIGAITFAYLQYPEETMLYISPIINTLMVWWQTVLDFFSLTINTLAAWWQTVYGFFSSLGR